MTERMHTPVLVEEVMTALAIRPGDTVVDATLGGAGHFARLLRALGMNDAGERGTIVGIDADPEAVERARGVYAEDRRPERPVAHLVNDDYRNLARILERLGIAKADAVLFDLGWSGYQLAGGRGFSFAHPEEPLLMRYGAETAGGETAAELVNAAPEQELARILAEYGEERFARGIARAIGLGRSKKRILTVGELVAAVEQGTPAWYRHRRIHPATKTFQALRIAVNRELEAIEEGVGAALEILAPGGRLAIITFHSIEDRLVKQLLRGAEALGRGSAAKKPVVPAREESITNRRARSAKLRVFTAAALPRASNASAASPPLLAYV